MDKIEVLYNSFICEGMIDKNISLDEFKKGVNEDDEESSIFEFECEHYQVLSNDELEDLRDSTAESMVDDIKDDLRHSSLNNLFCYVDWSTYEDDCSDDLCDEDLIEFDDYWSYRDTRDEILYNIFKLAY